MGNNRTYNSTFFTYTTASSGIGNSGVLASSGKNIEYYNAFAVQAVYTGGWAGSLSLLCSNDGTNFNTITNTSQVIAGAGSFTWNMFDQNYLYIQGKYAATSASSGVLSFILNTKAF